MNYIEFLRTYNAGDIALIKSILDGEKVDYKVKGENFNSMEPPVQPVTFFIREDQVDTAKDLLDGLDITFLGIS